MALGDDLVAAVRAAVLQAAREQPGAPYLPAGATAAEFSIARFGGPVKINMTFPTIGVAVSRLLGNNPRRVFWLAMNCSAGDGRVWWNNTLTSAQGILVAGSSGAASMAVDEDGEIVAWEVFAVSGAAGATWALIEIERV